MRYILILIFLSLLGCNKGCPDEDTLVTLNKEIAAEKTTQQQLAAIAASAQGQDLIVLQGQINTSLVREQQAELELVDLKAHSKCLK